MEYEVLLAGTRGGGKSLVLLFDALYDIGHPKFRGLVIRRNYADMEELIQRAKEYYIKVCPGTRWAASTLTMHFPSGARLEFGHLNDESALLKYQGQQYSWLGIDEITQIPEMSWYERLKGSVRSSTEGLRPRIRATTNPSGPGVAWVKKYWIDVAKSNEAYYLVHEIPGIGKVRIGRKWIHSSWTENPHLYERDPTYIAMLANASPAQRAAWYEGSWDYVEGAAFAEFDKATHVVTPFEIPHNWPRIRAADWGYSNPAVCVWGAIDRATDTIYIYREFVANNNDKNRMTAKEFGRKVLELEIGDGVRYGILDSATWARNGQSGPSPAEEMILEGCRWTPTDKPRTARVHGKYLMHSLLKAAEGQEPKIKFFSHCASTIEMMQCIPSDTRNVEDVDTDSPYDHWWDALRYLVMSRPNLRMTAEEATQRYRNSEPLIVNPTFGY